MKKQDVQLSEQELASIAAGMDFDLASRKLQDGGDVVLEESEEPNPSIGGVTPLPDPDHSASPGGRRSKARRFRL